MTDNEKIIFMLSEQKHTGLHALVVSIDTRIDDLNNKVDTITEDIEGLKETFDVTRYSHST